MRAIWDARYKASSSVGGSPRKMVVDRDPADARIPAVDLSHKPLYLRLQLGVPGDLHAAGNDHLEQTDGATHLRETLEKVGKSAQALRYPLRVVEPVDPQHYLPALVPAADPAHALFHLLRGRLPRVTGRVDADGEVPHPGLTVSYSDDVQIALHGDANVLHKRADTLDEVAAVTKGLHANEPVGQQRSEHCLTLGQLHEDVRCGERDMQEEGEVGGTARLARVSGHVHQLIVVDPDEVLRAGVGRQGLSEPLVDLDVRRPILGVEVRAGTADHETAAICSRSSTRDSTCPPLPWLSSTGSNE